LTTKTVAKQSTRIDQKKTDLSDDRQKKSLRNVRTRIGFVNPTIYHNFNFQSAWKQCSAFSLSQDKTFGDCKRDPLEASRLCL